MAFESFPSTVCHYITWCTFAIQSGNVAGRLGEVGLVEQHADMKWCFSVTSEKFWRYRGRYHIFPVWNSFKIQILCCNWTFCISGKIKWFQLMESRIIFCRKIFCTHIWVFFHLTFSYMLLYTWRIMDVMVSQLCGSVLAHNGCIIKVVLLIACFFSFFIL